MTERITHIPNYRESVEQSEWLARTRQAISQRSVGLLAKYRPDLNDLQRFAVPDDKVSWNVDFPDYDPPFVDEPYGRLTGKDADEVEDVPATRYHSWEGVIKYDEAGYPMNPVGRTGLRGRLTMNRFGPTHAADAIILRNGGEDSELLVVRRKDNGLIALPAGKLNPGETAVNAARRETREETGLDFDFAASYIVFSGMVDDDRATDTSWFETRGFLLRPSAEEADRTPIGADDAVEALWLPAIEVLSEPTHASTKLMVQLALSHVELTR